MLEQNKVSKPHFFPFIKLQNNRVYEKALGREFLIIVVLCPGKLKVKNKKKNLIDDITIDHELACFLRAI